MSVLKTLSFVAAPKHSNDPIHQRRSKLITQLQQQRELAEDPSYVVSRQRWQKSEDGSKRLVERQKRVKAWWQTDVSGNTIFVLRYGAKLMESEKGKAAISVGSKSNLVKTIDAVIAAVAAGELDAVIAATQGSGQKPKARAA